jgi:hypothetical protein
MALSLTTDPTALAKRIAWLAALGLAVLLASKGLGILASKAS